MAAEYLAFLRTILDKQRHAETKLFQLVEEIVKVALDHDNIQCDLKRFGSREYGNAVLSSDVDIVCQLPNTFWLYG